MTTTIKYQNLSATIKTKGAELVQLTKNRINYLWEIDDKFWNKTSPVLFPIVGRLKKDTYIFEDKKYSMNRHGFARDYDFQIVSQSENSVVFSLTENEATLKMYPFAFELQIEYILTAIGLRINYRITNNSISKMFFNLGAHPAFAITDNFNTYSLLFKENELKISPLENDLFTSRDKNLVLNNKALPLNYELFKNDALVFKSAKTRKVILKNKEKTILTIQYDNFPILGLWTKENAPFLCIEPWNGNADLVNASGKIEEKENILWLQSKSIFKATIKIKI